MPHGDGGHLLRTDLQNSAGSACRSLSGKRLLQYGGELAMAQQPSGPEKIAASRSVRLNLKPSSIAGKSVHQRARHVHIRLFILIRAENFDLPIPIAA